MFSNLENFLNAKAAIKVTETDSPDPSFVMANDSFDLDLSGPGVPKQKPQTVKKDGGDDGATFVPRKGQKLAAKRLKKIGDTLAKGLVDTDKMAKRIEKLKSPKKSPKKSKRQPVKKRTSRTSRRANLSDELNLDSDLDSEQLSHRAAPYDPNLIVLDCDDEFYGRPAVNLTRNFSHANGVSAEDSTILKVSVRINNKIEQFQMNPFQKLSALITKISEKMHVPIDHVGLMFKEKPVANSETPNSIGYVQGLVIKAFISDTMNKDLNAAGASSSNDDRNKLVIKIQSEGRKRPFITQINRTDQLITLAFACAEEFNCDVKQVIIEFDGEFVNFNETAEDLDLEGGEVMDFFQKKK